MLLTKVKNIPPDVVQLIGEAGVGSHYKCFSIGSIEAYKGDGDDNVPHDEEYPAAAAIRKRLEEVLGPEQTTLLRALAGMICRNSRVSLSVLNELQASLSKSIEVCIQI